MIFAIRRLIVETCPKAQRKAAQKWFLHRTNGKVSKNCVIYKPFPDLRQHKEVILLRRAQSPLLLEGRTFSNRPAALSTRVHIVHPNAIIHLLAVSPLPSTPCAVSEHIFHISPQSHDRYTQDPGGKFPCPVTAAAG